MIPDSYNCLYSVPSGSQIFVIKKILEDDVFCEEFFSSRISNSLIYVVLDDKHVYQTKQDLKFLLPNTEIITLPAWDSIPYDRTSPNNKITNQRIKTLSKLINKSKNKIKDKQILLISINSLTQKLIQKEALAQNIFHLKVGKELKREELTNFLVKNGYENVATASESGEFALRGSIIDIIPSNNLVGIRIDSFGDEIETIREFDPITQISKRNNNLTDYTLIPASEVFSSEENIQRFEKKYKDLFSTTIDDPLLDAVLNGRKYPGIENWLPLFYENLDDIFSYVKDAKIIFDHNIIEGQKAREEQIFEHYSARNDLTDNLKKLSEVKYNPIPPEQLYIIGGEWKNLLNREEILTLSQFKKENAKSLNYKIFEDFKIQSNIEKTPVFELIKKEYRKAQNTKTFLITALSKGSRERICKFLQEYEIPYLKIDHWEETKKLRRKGGKVGVPVMQVDNGFISDEIILITEQDIFGEKIIQTRKRKIKSEDFLKELAIFEDEDFIVHKEYGIGKFKGLKNITVKEVSHDFFHLVYRGGDALYVPVENIDLISRYGSSEMQVELDKLGNLAWQERSAIVKERIKLMAEELLKTAAQRSLEKSQIFIPDQKKYNEFCSKFPYPETEDQLSAISDILTDLASGNKAMDRLICGDVGFGKTEVALRATCAVSLNEDREKQKEKPQIAVFCPTTILCRQHFLNFSERFKGLGLKIKQLSRLVSDKEKRKIKEGIELGEIDILIGTHAILSKDIEFNNLALVIIDEEQRFGVAQKEKLKKLKSNTHVLTMTATPIPRTLQLSLSGIRDLSIIATPPIDRLAVRTYVMPYDPIVLRDAIMREYYRSGKCFYVSPRTKDLDDIQEKLNKLVPELKTVKAHGKLPPAELDKIMNDFYDGKYDILIATTIVESGLDIPNVNTLIVHKADMYGLAQLYQIRGRVGRGKSRAYAYLTLPEKRILTKQAKKRLEIMQKLDRLGAGFTLASHDMDIRGFGNLLGDEQSGSIKEVGVELYQSMLREAIQHEQLGKLELEEKEAKLIEEGGQKQEFTPVINTPNSVLIPNYYVKDLSLRLGLYRRIANLISDEEVDNMLIELTDRFGNIPEEVNNLLETVKLKNLAYKAGIEKIDCGSKAIVMKFYNNNFQEPIKLLEFINKNRTEYKLKSDQKLLVNIDKNSQQETKYFIEIKKSLAKIIELL